MFRSPLPSAFAAILLAACAGPTPTRPGEPKPDPAAAPAGAPEPVPVRRALPAGTVLRLRPTAVVVAGAPIDTGFTDALLREALRLSDRFDVAADLEDCESLFELVTTIDAVAGRVAIALREPDAPPTPLAGCALTAGSIPAAIDQLAWNARRALGEVVDAAPPSVADIYSSSLDCVRATERAQGLEARGGPTTREILDRALQADPGCTIALNARASWLLATGQPQEAMRTANQALRLFERRLAPTTSHRLARVLLLARARTTDPRAARGSDEQLLALGEAFVRERPHDPHGLYTRALAANFLGQFEAARRDFATLMPRWPKVPWVAYHLAFAHLGAGDAPAALVAIEQAARQLPAETTLMPRALALFGAGEHGELDELLARAAARDPEDSSFRHDVLRMQAAHAILTERREHAVRALLEDLEWLRQRPSILEERALEIAETGEVLVRLGASDLLATPLSALRDIRLAGETLGLALVFVEGLDAAERGEPALARVALGTLERAQRDAWAAQIRAAIARASGDAVTEARELATAIRFDDAPLVRAAFARSLRAMGRHEDADRLLDDTRQRLTRIRLREPLEHPLLSPGRALAFIATSPATR